MKGACLTLRGGCGLIIGRDARWGRGIRSDSGSSALGGGLSGQRVLTGQNIILFSGGVALALDCCGAGRPIRKGGVTPLIYT